MSRRTLRDRFLEKYEVDAATGCWVWTSAVDGSQYGVIWGNERGSAMKAHRVSYELFVGPIPAGMFVCHVCDNRLCVNPGHLWLGDAMANTQDKHRKGRANNLRGERHPDSVLTEQDVRVFRWAIRKGGRSYAEVARAYGVSETAVRSAVTGVTWAHVDYWPDGDYADGRMKLNPQAVIVIRHLARAGRPLGDLAKAYGIHYQTAYRIAAGLRWSHVDYPTTRDPVPEAAA